MKKLILFFSLITLLQTVFAQVNITLSMNPRPVARISEWMQRRDVLTLVASPGAVGFMPNNIKINTIIKTSDGATVATTDMLRAPSKTLVRGGNTIFYAADVVNLQAMVFESSYQDKINRTGKLPVGNYQVIVRLDSTALPVPLSNTQTKSFFLSATQLPVLINPPAGVFLDAASAQTAITFRWTAVTPMPVTAPRYRIQVYEVLENQQSVQAMRSNQPLLDQEVIGTTQYIWRPQLDLKLDSARSFIWSIQVYDDQGQPVASDNATGEARSEPKTFMIINKPSGNRLGKRNNGL